MHKVDFEGSIDTYQGKPVDPPITYKGQADAFDNLAEAKGSEDWPSDNEILKIINNKKLAAAKASLYQENTKELKAAYEKSPEFKRSQLVKALMLTGKSQVEAEALADSIVA